MRCSSRRPWSLKRWLARPPCWRAGPRLVTCPLNASPAITTPEKTKRVMRSAPPMLGAGERRGENETKTAMPPARMRNTPYDRFLFFVSHVSVLHCAAERPTTEHTCRRRAELGAISAEPTAPEVIRSDSRKLFAASPVPPNTTIRAAERPKTTSHRGAV